MIKLEKGAKVKVRLHTGKAVEAKYQFPVGQFMQKSHWVKYGRRLLLACSQITDDESCRFVGNPCVLLHEGVSV
jgi:hypothetical protein